MHIFSLVISLTTLFLSIILTDLEFLNEASPAKILTLFLFKRYLTPEDSFLAIERDLLTTSWISISPNLLFMPNFSDPSIIFRTSADLKNDFVGIHPQLRHIPPKASLSTIATFSPN